MTSLEHRLEELLKENTAIKERIKLAIEKEEVALAKGLNPPAWTAHEVGLIAQQQLLLAMGVVKVVGRSKKGELLVFRDREMVKRVLHRIEPPPPKPEIELPPDLFDNIVDYEDLKKAFIKALTAPKPVHILLVGPPASAKSLFLEEIERLPGSVFITAGTSTRAGIREIIFQQLPRYLLIDELDKVNDAKDLSALLTWMESGRIVRADWRGRVEKRGKGWVFAAANREERIPWEIRSRFLIFRLREYTREEYIEIAKTVLVRRENVPPDLAEYIATRVSEFSRNVRDAVKVGRMARTKEEVDEVVEILKRRS